MNPPEKQQAELKKNNREGNIQCTLIAKDLPLESTCQRTLLQALYEDSIMSFLTSVKALYVPCEKKCEDEDELKNAAKQKRDPSKILKADRRGRPLMLGPIDLMVQNYIRVNE